MGEPAVRRGAVPVLHLSGDVHHVAGLQRPGGLALLLIPAAAGHADQNLAAAALCVVDVPVVAAARLEGDVAHPHLAGGEGRKVALAHKVPGVGVVGRANGEHHLALMAGLFVGALLFGPHVLRHAEGRPRFGPAGVKGRVGENFGDLGAGDAVLLRRGQVIAERFIHQPLGHQRHHRDEGAVPQAEGALPAPHLAEQHVVVQMGELRGEPAQRVPSCRLFHCHFPFLPFTCLLSGCSAHRFW